MNRRVLICAWIALTFASLVTSANAQGRGRQRGVRRPSVSPYINMLNNDQDAVINYYGRVRPQFQQQQTNMQQNQAIQNLRTTVDQEQQQGPYGLSDLPTTGHAATYMNYSHYYGNRAGSTGRNQGGNRGASRARTPIGTGGGARTGMGMGM